MSDLPQHEGECCSSCLDDEEYDDIYSLWPKCCCRSTLSYEQALALALGGGQ